MKYAVLLRSINVGGNTIVSMKELKAAFEEYGFTNVVTYINSGNVILDSKEKDLLQLREEIEKLLKKTFHLDLKIVLRTQKEIESIEEQVPSSWKKETDIRCYVAFVREPVTVKEVVQEMEPREGIDSIDSIAHAVYMTTKMEGLTKSGLNKIAGKKVYKDITIRNYNTLKKIYSLMNT